MKALVSWGSKETTAGSFVIRANESPGVLTVERACQGAESVTVGPGALEARDLTVEMPTAGSLPLLFDAVLPLAANCGCPN